MKRIILTIVIIGIVNLSSAQSTFGKKKDKQEQLKPFEVTQYDTPFYKNNIGKLIFISSDIPINDIKETDVLNDFELKPGKGLSIKAITDNSLMNYGIQMYPNGNLDRLHTKLHYMFKFYLDGVLTFQRESTPQLIAESMMDKETVLSGTFIKLDKQPDWATNPWELFLKENVSKLSVGSHKLKIEIVPYIPYDMKDYFGDVVAAGAINLIIKQSQFEAKTMCPQPKMKDIALEKSIIAAVIDKSKEGIPLKAIIIDRDWTNVSSYSGVAHHRDIHAILIFKKEDKCYTKNAAFYQEFDGTKYGTTKLYNLMEGENMPCECLNVK